MVCTRVVVVGVILRGYKPNKIQFTLAKLSCTKARREYQREKRFT